MYTHLQMLTRHGWRGAALLAAFGLTAALATGGVALGQSAQVDQESEAPSAPILDSGGALDQVRIVTESVAVVLTPAVANSFSNVPGATTTMPVPANTSRLIIAEFTAESACYGGPAASAPWCSVRILINGAEANPVAGTDFAFDSTNALADGPASWESHTVRRSLRVRNVTTATINVPIQVQWANTTTTTTLRLDDWHLMVLRAV